MPRMRYPGAVQHRFRSPGKDAKVEHQAPVVDVPDVESEAFLPTGRVTTVDLGPARDPGKYRVTPGLVGRVQREVLDQQRAGADQAHVTAENVQELGDLVERRR